RSRRRRHGADASALAPPPAQGAGRAAEARPAVLLPSLARGGGRRAGAAGTGDEGAGRPRPVDPPHRPGETSRGGVLPRSPGTARDPPGLRGAVRAPARPGRGPPVRGHLPPAEARETRAV